MRRAGRAGAHDAGQAHQQVRAGGALPRSPGKPCRGLGRTPRAIHMPSGRARAQFWVGSRGQARLHRSCMGNPRVPQRPCHACNPHHGAPETPQRQATRVPPPRARHTPGLSSALTLCLSACAPHVPWQPRATATAAAARGRRRRSSQYGSPWSGEVLGAWSWRWRCSTAW